MAPDAIPLSRYHQDDGMNLRPYILAFCFFWGLLFGFLIYVKDGENRNLFHQNLAEEQRLRNLTQTQKPEPPVLQMTQNEVGREPRKMPVAPDVTNERPAEINVRDLLTSRSVGSFSRVWNGSRIPDHARIEMNPAWGLTRLTAPLPQQPVRLQDDPTRRGRDIDHLPVRDEASPRPPVPTPGLGEIEMPELDDF